MKIRVQTDLIAESFEKLKYTISFLLNSVGVSFSFARENEKYDLEIIYGDFAPLNRSHCIRFFQSEGYKKPSSLLNEIHDFEDRNLNFKVLGPTEDGKASVSFKLTENGYSLVSIDFDLLANIFFHLSRSEEKDKAKDMHKRYDSSFSILQKLGGLKTPLINKYLKLFNQTLEHVFPILITKEFFPQNETFGVVLTHDIDRIKKSGIKSSISSLFTKGLEGFQDFGDTFWNFETIALFEKAVNASSAFYFMTEAKDRDSIRYRIKSSKMKNLLNDLHRSQFEIGLHSSYYCDSKNRYDKEKQVIEKIIDDEVVGNRNHYLRAVFPESWQRLADAGFEYDTTLGYSDEIGYRSGYSGAYDVYFSDSESSLVEIPLTVMDSFFGEVPTEDDYQEKMEILEDLIYDAEENNGTICTLWHQSSWDEKYYGKLSLLYESFVLICSHKRAFIASPRELVSWKKARDSFQIIESKFVDDKYEILASVGESCEFLSLKCFFGKLEVGKVETLNASVEELFFDGTYLRIILKKLKKGQKVRLKIELNE